MAIGNSKIAIGLSLKLFDDLIRGLHQHNVNLRRVHFEQKINILEKLEATIDITVDINEPELEFESRGSNQQPIILAHLGGTLKPKITFAEQTSDTLFEIPFFATAMLQVGLRQPHPAHAPQIGLDYLGVKNVSEPLDDKFVNDLFNESEYAKLIQELKLDILEPVIAGMEKVYYADPLDVDDSQVPSHGSYPVVIRHMEGAQGTLNGIGVFFQLPNETIDVGLVPSFIPGGSEFFVQVSTWMIQSMVEKFKGDLQEWIENFAGSIKVNTLDLAIQDNAISVYGKVTETETDSTGTVSGKFHFNHRPGLKKIILDGSDIDIDIDLPWWADMLLIIFFPIGIVVYSAIDYVEDKVPEIGQKMIGQMFNDMMDNLAASINLQGLSVGNVPVEVYPDTIKLDDNALSMKVQILIQPITETIVWADYGKILGKFMYFHLASGRQFRTEDLIRFMKMGLIRVPGYHIYANRFIRSNPDNKTNNNLLERFGR
ncbi:MAG: hypothetical protein P8100_04410 [bacterium]